MNRTELASIWPPTAEVSAAAGHRPKSPMKAIREKCLDCTANQPSEVQRCEAASCALWPFRANKHPYTSGAREKSLHEHDRKQSGAVYGED